MIEFSDEMGKINSKRKGARGELEFSKLLKEYGFDARRSQQYCGEAGDADIICDGLDEFHFEVKFVEQLNLVKAFEQAKGDCPANKVPVIAHRRKRTNWKVTMDFSDWITLVLERDGVLAD